jgi:hypothetical protein
MNGKKIVEIQFHKLYRSTYVMSEEGHEDGEAHWEPEALLKLEEFIKNTMEFDGQSIGSIGAVKEPE